MYCRKFMDTWSIRDQSDNVILVDDFKSDLENFIFNKVGKIIEEDYFANELEPKWNAIKREIEMPRVVGEEFTLTNKADFLEFFVIQYLRLEGVITDEIQPVLKKFRSVFASLGFEESELNGIKEDGLLTPEPYVSDLYRKKQWKEEVGNIMNFQLIK